jgi:hypothetical protein
MAEQNENLKPKFFSGAEVRNYLDISEQTLTYKRRLNEVISVESEGDFIYPSFQFKDGDLVIGLDKVLEVLIGNSISMEGIIIFLESKNRGLDGAKPIDALINGETSDVITIAERHGQMAG